MKKIIAICTSEKKGTQKHQIESAKLIKDFGMENDAHAGNWHRQISLLALHKIEDFKNKGVDIDFGAFGENLVVSGIELNELPVGQKIKIGEILLEVTQIGKKCHDKCEIFYRVGNCIMPTNGIFAKVLEGGNVFVGDSVELL